MGFEAAVTQERFRRVGEAWEVRVGQTPFAGLEVWPRRFSVAVQVIDISNRSSC